MTDTWKLFKQTKREYLDKLEDAYARGLMTTDEYEEGKRKVSIRVLQMVNQKLVEAENDDRLGN